MSLNFLLLRLSPDRPDKTMTVPGLGVGAPEVKNYDDGDDDVDDGDDDGDDGNDGDDGDDGDGDDCAGTWSRSTRGQEL